MGEIRHFTDLKVWQAAHRLFGELASDFGEMPKSLSSRIVADQILRSSGSIGANIAEGFNAATTREHLRYLDIARRTANETEHWLHCAVSADLIAADRAKHHLATCAEIRRMLAGLQASLRTKIPR
jgi:four helix bundle protein